MSRLYMIRHGKPASTWGDRGDADPGLDESGHAEARAARDRLMSLPQPPMLVVSSPLRRCRETAQPLAEALGVTLEIDPAVGEIPTPAALSHDARPDWLKRAFAGRWDEIIGDLDYDAWRHAVGQALMTRADTAVFSHYVAINAAVSCVTGEPAVLSFRPDHCSITTFDLIDGRLALAGQGRQAETQVL